MYGNFYRGNRQNGGSKLEVEGWIVWEAGDTSANLTISVNQGLASGTSKTFAVTPASNPGTPANPGKWQATVSTTGPAFVQGPGVGGAGAMVQNGASSSNQSWTANPLDVN